MNKSYRDILSEILQIVNYQNKEKFVAEFEGLNHLDAMANIMPSLSSDVREYIKINASDPEKIKKYIPQDLYIKELTKVSADALKNFIIDISSALTIKQKQEIAALLASY